MCSWARLYQYDSALGDVRAADVVGVDEAGRGPLAGPVVAAAVMLDPDAPIERINDSKKLNETRREALYERIVQGAPAWAVGIAEVEEIDRHNILHASLLAMHRALQQMERTWSLVLVDGNRGIPWVAPQRQRTVVGGDGLSACVAAASIVAKVTRDRMMRTFGTEFPVYEFARHKGYPTALHMERIRQHGLCRIHRRSFCEKLAVQTVLEF